MFKVLNIVSDTLVDPKIGGPNKVIINTIKGLEAIGQPYVVNKNVYKYQFNWIHDSIKGFIEVSIGKIPAVVGPNLVVLPKDLPRCLPDIQHLLYLHPSHWCVEVWKELGFNKCPLFPWPVGIDTDEFRYNKRSATKQNVMIYFKKRDPGLLKKTTSLIERFGHTSTLVEYGTYSEEYYKMVLKESGFGIWLGISESQGIALQEALATGLPLIICDVKTLFESSDKNDYKFPERLKSFKPTSAPYFDERCGIIINDFSKLEESLNLMLANISNYKPRDFIEENLSLEKQAKDLLFFFQILEHNHNDYFNKPVANIKLEDFKISLRGRLIYLVFILTRKIKTMIRLIKTEVMRIVKTEQQN